MNTPKIFLIDRAGKIAFQLSKRPEELKPGWTQYDRRSWGFHTALIDGSEFWMEYNGEQPNSEQLETMAKTAR